MEKRLQPKPDFSWSPDTVYNAPGKVIAPNTALTNDITWIKFNAAGWYVDTIYQFDFIDPISNWN